LAEYLILYHFHFSPKFSYKNITYNLILKYIYHFSYFVVSIILVQIYHHMQNIHLLLNSSKELSTSSSKIFKISKVHNIFIKFGVHILSNFWNAKNYTLWEQFWGILMCFCWIPTFYSSVKYGYKFFKM